MAAAKTKSKTLRIRQTRSAIGANPKAAATLAALGLGRIGNTVERGETPQLLGQLHVVRHLVETEEVS